MTPKPALDTLIIGGGMITYDLILPSAYHLQRLGSVGPIKVCAQSSARIRALKESADLKATFPGQDFAAYPDVNDPQDRVSPDLYRKLLAEARPRQAVIIATPDNLHFEMVMNALRADQHVLCVKPLVLKYTEAVEIERFALERGLFVGIEYHKRLDTRALMARRQYRLGHFGEFRMGEARMVEPYYYRHSNFQNWFTTDQTDPFVYVGCHYVDLVQFITGLRPVAVSVSGVKGRFPNGKEGYMWANGRVRYENGAVLSVIDGLGYPDDGAGSNDQGLLMYCEGKDRGGMIQHNDQDRGVRHSYLENIGCAGTRYNYVSPDFYRLVPWAGPGYRPAGYGYESIAASLESMRRIEAESAGLAPAAALERRRAIIREIDETGLLATPANSATNELVVEAARLSILADGDWCEIHYGDRPHVAMRR
ncbi:MAG: putative oxidoreductase YdgJ [Verrucomicrobiota bacterium]|jgi:predicted dehydrogenase